MGRSPCCSKVGLRRGPWSTKEDDLLTTFILENGEGQWRSLPKKTGLLRCGKSCRLRWMNYLRPGIKRGNISEEEEDLILRMHRLLGNRWSLIAGRLPGRTDNEIKNYWNTHVLKKLQTDVIRNKKETSPSPKKKKKRLPGKAEAEPAREAVGGREQGENAKLYLPTPIRVSPAFSRTSSCDSLASGGSIGSGVADVGSCVPWASLFELEEACGGSPEDFLGTGSILPLPHQGPAGEVGMLEQVYYDEYLQLLSNE